MLSGKSRLVVCLQDGDVDSGVGRNWCDGRNQAINRENYKNSYRPRLRCFFFKFRTASVSVFVSLSLGLEEIFIILTVSSWLLPQYQTPPTPDFTSTSWKKPEYGESLKSREILNLLEPEFYI